MTRLIRATLAEARNGQPLHAGPVFAGPFHAAGEPDAAQYTYGRSHNPTWTEAERAIAVLEGDGAQVRLFGSGMAAEAALFGAVLRPGDTVVLPEGLYFGGRRLLEERFVPVGIRVEVVKASELVSACAGARLVWVETPSNPELEITDVAAVAKAAHAAGALVAVDTTTATPLGLRALELGADVSVCSDSKAMCGHSDLLLGHVAVKDAGLLEAIDRERTLSGGIAGPMEAWLLVRSLGTLPLRLARTSDTALAIAEWLCTRGDVRNVMYPGLMTHAGHAIAAEQMRFFGPVLSFALASQSMAEKFLQKAELITEATSFGGIATTAERRARWGHDRVAPGFIRMSAGCEDPGDLIDDMERALDGLAR